MDFAPRFSADTATIQDILRLLVGMEGYIAPGLEGAGSPQGIQILATAAVHQANALQDPAIAAPMATLLSHLSQQAYAMGTSQGDVALVRLFLDKAQGFLLQAMVDGRARAQTA